MDIYSYIKSPDISDYCKKIGHIFNPLEMAVIIAISDRTMQEKHTAWHRLIEEYPDMPISGTRGFRAHESLHEYLRELIAYEEREIEAFFKPDTGAVYSLQAFWRQERDDEYGLTWDRDLKCDSVYSTFEKAWAALLKIWKAGVDAYPPVSIKFVKTYVDTEDCHVGYFNKDGGLRRLFHYKGASILSHFISYSKDRPDDLESISIYLPVPFEKGDLVTNEDGKPRVLESLPRLDTEYKEGDSEDGYRGYRHESDHTSSYYISEHDNLTGLKDHTVGRWDLRYFRGELKGQEHFLKYLSQYMKDKEKSIDWLIDAFMKFKIAEVRKSFIEFFAPE